MPRIPLDISPIGGGLYGKLVAGVAFSLANRLNVHRLQQRARGCQDLVLGEECGHTGGLGDDAGVEARILCIEHVEQRALADLELDAVKRQARRAGQDLRLTAKEFSLLWLLLRRKGEVLSRTELAELVWDMHFDSETNVVDVAVRRLRSKMDEPFAQPLLHTVRGMGYVLEHRAVEQPS